MVRKVIIEALLVNESIDEKPEKIEREILKEFSERYLCLIPWCERIEKVRVVDS